MPSSKSTAVVLLGCANSFRRIQCQPAVNKRKTPKKSSHVKSCRFSGGIVIGAKKLINPYISVIKKTPNYIWCKIDKSLFQADKDISLCSCYIPPKDSPYYDPDTFSNLENDINLFQKDYSVILAGDFNARTGVENDFINYDSCNFNFYLETTSPCQKKYQ